MKLLCPALLCLLLLWPAACLRAQTPTYTVIDLGSFGMTSDGSSNAHASSLSADESVAGYASVADPFNGPHGIVASLWQHGALSNLGALGTNGAGGTYSAAVSVNTRAQAVGFSDWYDYTTYRGRRACLFEDGYVLNLGTLGETMTGYGDSTATRVNDAGQTVGSAQIYLSDGSSPGHAPVLWNGLAATDLGTLGTGFNGQRGGTALRVNNSGQVVGNTSVYDDAHTPRGTAAFFWQNGRMTDMTGTTFGEDIYGYRQATVADLNAHGQAVGTAAQHDAAHNPLGTVGFLWQNGRITPIDLAAHGATHAVAVNDAGQVAGYVYRIDSRTNTSRTEGFFWQNGRAVDLGRLGADAQGNGYTRATGLNEAGQVVGLSRVYDALNPQGVSHPFVWQQGRMTDLFALLPADTETYSLDSSFPRINAQGEITLNISRGVLGTHALLLRPASAHKTTAISLSAGASGASRLLWDNVDGSASFWRVPDAGGDPMYSPAYGPYAGWGAQAIAAAPDGSLRLLWTNADGRAGVWTVATDGTVNYGPTFGPYAGWSARAVAVAPDGSTRLLWVNQNGWASAWTLRTDGAISYSSLQYGPSGAHAIDIAAGPDGGARFLWVNADGGAFVRTLTADGRAADTATLGPFPGWQAQTLTVNAGRQNRLLWANADGRAWLSSSSAADNPASASAFGSKVYAFGADGWMPRRASASPDGTTRLLWTNTDGRASVWTLAANGAVTQKAQFGPF